MLAVGGGAETGDEGGGESGGAKLEEEAMPVLSASAMSELSAAPGGGGETGGLGDTWGCKSPELSWLPQELSVKAAIEMSAAAIKTIDGRQRHLKTTVRTRTEVPGS